MKEVYKGVVLHVNDGNKELVCLEQIHPKLFKFVICNQCLSLVFVYPSKLFFYRFLLIYGHFQQRKQDSKYRDENVAPFNFKRFYVSYFH